MAAPQLAPFDTAARPSIASNIVRMEKMLVPVDFSEPCLRVVRHASKFARYFGSEVTVLHVQPAIENSARERLESFGQVILEGLSVRRVLLRSSDPANSIVEVAHRDRVGMIFMPTYGASPFRKLILGSVTEKILQQVNWPVCTGVHLDERMRFDRKPIRKIVCAVDRDSHARSVLAWVRDFAGTLGAAVTVVHAITALPDLGRNSWSLQLRRDGEAAVKRQLHELAIRADLHVETGEVTPVVMAALGNTEADLLVIGRSTRGDPFGPIVTNSYSLIRHSNCPVISV